MERRTETSCRSIGGKREAVAPATVGGGGGGSAHKIKRTKTTARRKSTGGTPARKKVTVPATIGGGGKRVNSKMNNNNNSSSADAVKNTPSPAPDPSSPVIGGSAARFIKRCGSRLLTHNEPRSRIRLSNASPAGPHSLQNSTVLEEDSDAMALTFETLGYQPVNVCLFESNEFAVYVELTHGMTLRQWFDAVDVRMGSAIVIGHLDERVHVMAGDRIAQLAIDRRRAWWSEPFKCTGVIHAPSYSSVYAAIGTLPAEFRAGLVARFCKQQLALCHLFGNAAFRGFADEPAYDPAAAAAAWGGWVVVVVRALYAPSYGDTESTPIPRHILSVKPFVRHMSHGKVAAPKLSGEGARLFTCGGGGIDSSSEEEEDEDEAAEEWGGKKKIDPRQMNIDLALFEGDHGKPPSTAAANISIASSAAMAALDIPGRHFYTPSSSSAGNKLMRPLTLYELNSTFDIGDFGHDDVALRLFGRGCSGDRSSSMCADIPLLPGTTVRDVLDYIYQWNPRRIEPDDADFSAVCDPGMLSPLKARAADVYGLASSGDPLQDILKFESGRLRFEDICYGRASRIYGLNTPFYDAESHSWVVCFKCI